MYDSIAPAILIDENTKSKRTNALHRLYEMGFNLIPIDGKHPPCIEWKPYQTRRVTLDEIKEWMRGRFPRKDGNGQWKARNLNFGLVTGAIPWSPVNPGIVVIDSDDEEGEALVQQCCPDTPMKQRTGNGGFHRVYRRPPVETIPKIANRQKTDIGGRQYNIDLRADGGYIICPGSIHPKTGNLYVEEMPWTMELLSQCPVYDPAWLPIDQATEGNRHHPSSAANARKVSDCDHADLIAEVTLGVTEREEQARHYLESVPGTTQGTGADKACTTLAMKLLYGFALPADTVREMLVEWGQKDDQRNDAGGWYPWTEGEIARKIDWCLEHEYRGEVGDRLHNVRDIGEMESEVESIVGSFDVDGQSLSVTIDPKDHLDVATRFFRHCFWSDERGTLIHHHGQWQHWTGKRYETVSDDDIKARLWKWLARCSFFNKDKRRPFQPTRNVVAGILDALKAVANKSASLEAPCWLTSGPAQIIAFDNGLLDVDSLLQTGSTTLLPHTPDWFSTNCLPHRFDPSAACPKWHEFLEQVFDGDEERISTIQQWFGYNLIADNRQHKIAMLIGPPRSGKGTTMAVLSSLLGKYNVANSSLASLGGRFGLEPLVGKLAALIDEGHLGKFSDTSLVLERLKAISGGSEQAIDRKGIAALANVALKVRFTIAVNELPRLSDSSAAMRSRLLIIPYFNSYEGKEDFGLVDGLLTEIPGITNWALNGLRLLSEAGRFQSPKAGEKILRDFVYLSSPVQAFLDECCEVNSEASVSRNDLQLAWHVWCDENGHVHGSNNDFGRKLRAAIPRIDDDRRRVGGSRERWYMGVGLTPEALADITRVRNGA